MARRHGWQLPAHTFQVVAITVFFLLAIAFYSFFAPFLGHVIYEYVAMGVYTFLVERFACLYTCQVANLSLYSPNKYYRPNEDFMPHEFDILAI